MASGVPVNFTHDTRDGPIRLRASRSDQGRWIARFWGRQLEGAREFRSLKAANEYLLRSFAAMFPGHRCTSRCGPGTDRLAPDL